MWFHWVGTKISNLVLFHWDVLVNCKYRFRLYDLADCEFHLSFMNWEAVSSSQRILNVGNQAKHRQVMTHSRKVMAGVHNSLHVFFSLKWHLNYSFSPWTTSYCLRETYWKVAQWQQQLMSTSWGQTSRNKYQALNLKESHFYIFRHQCLHSKVKHSR